MKQLFFLFLLVMLIFSCRKSYECNMKDEITYENIPDSNISQIPYKGNEILSFVNDLGDTAVFKCTGYKNYYDESFYWNGNPDCQWKSITKTQQIDFTFIDTANLNRNFRVKYEAHNSPFVLNNVYTSILYYIPSDKYISARDLDYFYNIKNLDSILLKNNRYVNGAFILSEKDVFYNLNQGIIQFTDQFQNKWTLLN